MWEEFRFNRWLARAQRNRDRLRRQQAREIIEAHSGNIAPDEMAQLENTHKMERELLGEEIASTQSAFLLRQAEKYFVPVPPRIFAANQKRSEDWIRSPNFGTYLTPGAMMDMRSAIRQVRRENFEEFTRWLPFVSATTGLLGVVVAILALVLKLHGH